MKKDIETFGVKHSLILNLAKQAINKTTMAKKAEKAKSSKSVEKPSRIEKERKKPGRKPLKVPLQSPRGETSESVSVEEPVVVVKKPRGRKVNPRDDDSVEPVNKSEIAVIDEEIESTKTLRDNDESKPSEEVWQRFDQLTSVVEQLKETTTNKIEELQTYVNNTIKSHEPIELDPAIIEWIRKTVADEISKEFKIQFENFKEAIIETKLKKISKFSKRGRPAKAIRPTTPKSSDEEITEPPTQKKRGRKKKTLEDVSIKRIESTKNLSSMAEIVDDTKRDFRINNIITFSNLTEQPEPRREPARQVEPRVRETHKSAAAKAEIEERPKEQDSSALLPSVPLKSIQALIEDHKSELAGTKKSITSETPVYKSKKVKVEQQDDLKSVRTEAEGGRNSKATNDIDVEFDFNAFSLNN